MDLKKTDKMKRAEERLGRGALEKELPELINEYGFSDTARRLGVSKATLNYWMLKLGIQLRRVAIGPNEEIEIRRRSI